MKEHKTGINRLMSEGYKRKNYLLLLEELITRYRWILLCTALIILVLLPHLGVGQYILRICILIGIYVVLGHGLNILVGYTGMVSLGHAGFYGVGAYTATILMLRLGMNFFLASFLGALMSASVGALICLPTLRLRGPYISIVTLGAGEILKMVFLNWDAVTNGAFGLRNIPRPSIFGYQLTMANYGMYYLMLVMVILVTLACSMIINSKVGRAFISIKEDELAATMMGINVVKYKEMAFFVSAFITGLAGAYYASMLSYIDPNCFTNDVSNVMLSVVILGGMGTLRGMFLGAAILLSFPEAARFLMDYRFVFYGLVLIFMMRFRPQGLLGWKSQLPYRFPKKAAEVLASKQDLMESSEKGSI